MEYQSLGLFSGIKITMGLFCVLNCGWARNKSNSTMYYKFYPSSLISLFRYCVTIRREQYPHDNVKPSMYPLPGHTLLVMPTVTMVNLLPIEMTYYLKGTEITGTVKAGQEAQLHAVSKIL